MADQNLDTRRREFLDWCVKERDDAATQLARFEAGFMQVGVSGAAGYIDGSAAAMVHLRHVIESMDGLIVKIGADLEGAQPDHQSGFGSSSTG